MEDSLSVESGSIGVVDCVSENGRRVTVIPGVVRFVEYSI